MDAMLMKGLLCKWQQQSASACQWFRKVIYSCPECWPAHFYLADIRRTEEQCDAALKAYQSVVRILASDVSSSHCLQWIPAPLTGSDALFLSQRQVQQLIADLHSTQVDG